MEQATIQLSVGSQDTPKSPGTGTAGPTKEDPVATDKAVTPPADTGSPATEAPITVLPTHADHLTAQQCTEKPHTKIHQVSHIASNTQSSQEDKLPIDVASDEHM